MFFKKSEIKKALEFYDITDIKYRNKCYECLDYLEDNRLFLKSAIDIYKTIYNSKSSKIRRLWKNKSIEELFRCKIHKYISNVLVLSAYKKHQKNIKKYGFDDNQQTLQKRRVKECLLSESDIKNGISTSKMLWAAYIIKGKIIEVGRLQYELIDFNPLNPIESKKCIKIHIPTGSKLYEELVLTSIKESKELIKKYYKLKNIDMFCDSWLLSREIKSEFPNSNIAKFASLFDVLKEEDGTLNLLHFVFKKDKCEDYNELSENTNLEKFIKKMLINGQVIHKGIGKLKDIN